MLILRVQHNWLQKEGTSIAEPVIKYYNLFHFPTPVDLEINGEIIRTRPNACVFSAPMAPRGFHFFENTRMNWIHAYREIEPLLETYEIPLNCLFYPKNPGFISDIIRKMRLEILADNPYREDMLDSYARELLINLSRAITGNAIPEISSAEQKKMHRLRWQVLSEPEKKWTVTDMAELASLSPSRFHAVYKAMFGTSPMKDVINAKIDSAKTLLLMDENPTLSEVAERLGYKNQQHFIGQFKAVTGMTPGAYRKNNK